MTRSAHYFPLHRCSRWVRRLRLHPLLRYSRLDHSYLHSQWPLLIPWVRMYLHSLWLRLIPWGRRLLRNPLLP